MLIWAALVGLASYTVYLHCQVRRLNGGQEQQDVLLGGQNGMLKLQASSVVKLANRVDDQGCSTGHALYQHDVKLDALKTIMGNHMRMLPLHDDNLVRLNAGQIKQGADILQLKDVSSVNQEWLRDHMGILQTHEAILGACVDQSGIWELDLETPAFFALAGRGGEG